MFWVFLQGNVVKLFVLNTAVKLSVHVQQLTVLSSGHSRDGLRVQIVVTTHTSSRRTVDAKLCFCLCMQLKTKWPNIYRTTACCCRDW